LKSLGSVGTPFVAVAPRSGAQTERVGGACAELARDARQLKKTAGYPESFEAVAAGRYGW